MIKRIAHISVLKVVSVQGSWIVVTWFVYVMYSLGDFAKITSDKRGPCCSYDL